MTYNFSALVILGCACTVLRGAYPVADMYLIRYAKYKELSPSRRLYLIKNFLKSYILMILCIGALKPVIIPAIMYNEWNTIYIQTTAALYASNDIMGLIMVKDLHQSTKMHHTIVTALCLTSFGIEFQTSHVGKMMFVYTISSSHAYLVNFYLGARLLVEKARLEMVRITSRNIYFVCCLVNWSWHILWILNNYNIISGGHLLYFCVLFWIIKDDIILLSWLNNSIIKFN